MSIILTEEEYEKLKAVECSKCIALRVRFDEAASEFVETVIKELKSVPGLLDALVDNSKIDERLRNAANKFTHTL